MCGRFVARNDLATLTQVFRIDRLDEQVLESNYNTAPTQRVYLVATTTDAAEQDDATAQDDASGEVQRRLAIGRWGLIPSWSKERSIGARMINARAETVSTKPSFRSAFTRRRCIVPVDGFYEWRPTPARGPKQPFYIHHSDPAVALAGLAGLYEWWRDPQVVDPHDPQAWVLSCTILTMASRGWMTDIHDRMPVAVDPSDWSAWLEPTMTDRDSAERLLDQVMADGGDDPWTGYPVSTEVNKTSHNGQQLIAPLEQ